MQQTALGNERRKREGIPGSNGLLTERTEGGVSEAGGEAGSVVKVEAGRYSGLPQLLQAYRARRALLQLLRERERERERESI